MDIRNPRVLKIKGLLFLALGLLSASLLLMQCLSPAILILLLICIWSFCRFYYFAFYVLHHYADPDFRYSGLWDLFRYLSGSRKPPSK